MAEFFKSASGVVFELDVPDEGTMQRERHDEKVAAGDLVAIPADAVEKQVDADGTYRWAIKAPAARATKRSAPKAEPSADQTDA
ncbi:MAG: hypothetical protein MUE78_10460 [Ilumatobacteraceae bacterium]|jgi:hypothetical protein|nr:hypothetical protein [Ilumatobacteraceae bacterium]